MIVENRTKKRVYKHFEGLSVTANFSEDRRFRYMLEIAKQNYSSNDRIVCVIMLNPSYADENTADKSIKFLENFIFNSRISKFKDISKLIVVNLFAYVQTKDFEGKEEKIGPENNYYIDLAISKCDSVLLAWGKDHYKDRINFVIESIKKYQIKLVFKTDKHPSIGRYAEDFLKEYKV